MKLNDAHVKIQPVLGPSWRCSCAIIWKSANQTNPVFPVQPKWLWKLSITGIFHWLSPLVIYYLILPAFECCLHQKRKAAGTAAVSWTWRPCTRFLMKPLHSGRNSAGICCNKAFIEEISVNQGRETQQETEMRCDFWKSLIVSAIWELNMWQHCEENEFQIERQHFRQIEPHVFGESFGWLCLKSACLPCLRRETCEMTPAHREDGHKLVQSHFLSRI